MEDAELIKTDLPDGGAIFGVFDGHGGRKLIQFFQH